MCLDLRLELGVVCWLHLDLVAIAADDSSVNLGVLTRQRQMNLELYSVVWSRWLPSVHSMFDFAFPVEPRTFPSVPMSVLSCTRALTRLLFFPWTRPSLSTHISGLFESFELGIEIPEPTGLRLQFCRLARNERSGDESSLTQFRWCDFGSRERFDLRRAPDPSRPPPGRRRDILNRQAS